MLAVEELYMTMWNHPKQQLQDVLVQYHILRMTVRKPDCRCVSINQAGWWQRKCWAYRDSGKQKQYRVRVFW